MHVHEYTYILYIFSSFEKQYIIGVGNITQY